MQTAPFAILWLACTAVLATTAGCDNSFRIHRGKRPPARWDGKSLLIGQPVIRPNPIARAPLAAIIEFESYTEIDAVLEISDGERTWTQRCAERPQRLHRVAVLGMRPNRKHSIFVRATRPDGTQGMTSRELTFLTPPLPADFPPLESHVETADPQRSGITMFAVNLWRDDANILDYGYIVGLDSAGEVVWYCKTDHRITDLRLLSNGHLIYEHGSFRAAYEIDVFGREIRSWYCSRHEQSHSETAIPIDVDTLHHVLQELPNGNILTLATEIRRFDTFPTSEFDPDAPWRAANVVCDAVVEFKPGNGEVVQRLHLADLLDPKRFGYISLGGFWNPKYPHIGKVYDWSHANAVVFIPEEEAIIVSLRHLDCLIKIDWNSQQIVWILGDPGGWGEAWQKYVLAPVGDTQWFYHQHAPQLTPTGTILLYDNGNYRARPFNPMTAASENFSRIVEFRVDEQAMTVEQIFEYRGGPGESFYCPFYGEADWLPQSDTLLITNGGHIELDDGTPADIVPSQRQWARILEIERKQPHRVVFDVTCQSPLGSSTGWSIYRAMRLPDFNSSFRIDPPH
ncbi:MAG: aryl-sulfate sulfotransferase [Pirellulaceae bacterium]